MRTAPAFILVMITIASLLYVGYQLIGAHGIKYGGQVCGGSFDVKCPAGYECIDRTGKTIYFGELGRCRFLLQDLLGE